MVLQSKSDAQGSFRLLDGLGGALQFRSVLATEVVDTAHTNDCEARNYTAIMCEMDVATGARLPGGGTASSDALPAARSCGNLQ